MSSVSEGSGSNQDCELNLAPIIDCFTVLIAYLIVSASFIGYMALDVGISVSQPPSNETPPAAENPLTPPLNLGIELKSSGIFELTLSGGEKNLDQHSVVAPDSKKDSQFTKLLEKLVELKEQYSAVKEVNFTAEPNVSYNQIIKSMETIKPIYPQIFLLGERVVSSEEENHEK